MVGDAPLLMLREAMLGIAGCGITSGSSEAAHSSLGVAESEWPAIAIREAFPSFTTCLSEFSDEFLRLRAQGRNGHFCTACAVAFTQTASSPWIKHEGQKKIHARAPAWVARLLVNLPVLSLRDSDVLASLRRSADAQRQRWPGGPESSTRPSDNGLQGIPVSSISRAAALEE